MLLPSLPTAALLALALQSGVNAATTSDGKSKKPVEPCTITSSSGSFYDLRALSAERVAEGKKATKGARTEDWHSKGYDYNANFTLNFCAPVVDQVSDVIGIHDKARWGNVSAYYQQHGKIYSIGQQSSNLTLRGKRLVLQYDNGSPCESPESTKRATIDQDAATFAEDAPVRHKSTLISFHCEKDPVAQQAAPSFIGTPDGCAYFFEIRSAHACGGAEPTKQGVGPGAVFAIIGVIAILVYFLGGVFYQRNVAHARGWRQLPNYSMWASAGNFIKDMFIIATSSCASIVPRRRGYSALSISANGNSSGRGGRNSRDDENRLIDQLDEEWDD
ncbi:vacuolar sorting receptor (Mrl1)-like protein [Coleophoma cylindrospora]|uniref:Vacuolar sorting receptor (Mrl1)-like protein n=1 Tax=Coleophoma cylindrospora TaxID=1849047 RepID=A0A3D8RB53_9HELO|nr:vacuolar sorting receptor (Mrl1)-like protein [Coleophoma cylindrospora]